MITAHEGHKEVLARGISHELHGVFDGLCAAHVELDSSLQAEGPQTFQSQLLGHQHFVFMEILAGKLRKPVQLGLQRIDDALVAIAEIDRRVPHLEIEVGFLFAVVEKASFAVLKKFRHGRVMDRVSMRAILGFFFTERFFTEMDHWERFHAMRASCGKRRSATSASVSNGMQGIPVRSHHSRSEPLAKTVCIFPATH
ncbi:hypothetical protein EMGBD2_18240 [Nitrospirota bacterium]|nr:hypothetical protein EMGBD2_18240 [Nitrospirota bacterium]